LDVEVSANGQERVHLASLLVARQLKNRALDHSLYTQ
jgi:hypothetical protein